VPPSDYYNINEYNLFKANLGYTYSFPRLFVPLRLGRFSDDGRGAKYATWEILNNFISKRLNFKN